MARAVGLIEETGRRHGDRAPDPDDGRHHRRRDHLGVPLLQRGASRSLFHSTDIADAPAQYPDNPVLHDLSDDARLVVSEPLGDLAGAWREVPESTCVVVRSGHEETHDFVPLPA